MAYSAVGTPDYIAPEILTGQGHTFDCDWWSLGTIMFECLVGWPPFCAEDRREVYRKIVNWQYTLYFPEDIRLSVQSEHLIRRYASNPHLPRSREALLTYYSLICNSERRLGRSGAREVKMHPFFAGVGFDNLRRFRAPFEPRLTSEIDTIHFPTEDLEQQALNVMSLDAEPEQEETPEMALPFVGYTFKRFESNFR